MQSPGRKGVAAFGWHTCPAAQPAPWGALPQAFPTVAQLIGGNTGAPPPAAHVPPVTVGFGDETELLQPVPSHVFPPGHPEGP